MFPDQLLNETKQKMQGTVNHLSEEISGIRGSRAHPGLMEGIKVDAYGSKMSLKELGSVNVLDPHMLQVQVWDQANVPAVDKAIREANLGLNPVTENNIIRVPIPPLSEERRKQMSKLVSEKSEAAHVSIRNVRREAIEQIGKAEKSGQITEDDKFRQIDQMQQVTDGFSKQVDDMAKQKAEEVMKF